MEERQVNRAATCGERSLDFALSLELLPLQTTGRRTVGTLSAFSYVADVRQSERRARPVLFLTNGGPGAASSYLHLSGIGPFRARMPDDLAAGVAAPFGIEDSPSSILDAADLVFLDAADTGYGFLDGSGDVDTTQFFSVEGDGDALAAAITAWVTKHRRWDSPKLFLGESYGTHRAAFLATSTHGMDTVPLDGIVLLGQAVNIQEVAERPGNVVGALANVPYKAAAAWYHGMGSAPHETVDEAVQAALDFAWTDLALAMLQGTALPRPELETTAERLSAMIGIPADELIRSRLWMSKRDFRGRLLRDRDVTLGINDSRYTGLAADEAAGELALDPSSTHLSPRYTAAFHQLLEEVFDSPISETYRMFSPAASRSWEWSEQGGAKFFMMSRPSPFHTYPYPARLSRWMKQVPHGRLFIGTGVYDSLTTVGAADHLVRQWDLPRERVESHWYGGGHMMYSDVAVGARLNADLRSFIRGFAM